MSWYNNVDKIFTIIRDEGMVGLTRVINERYTAHYTRREILKERIYLTPHICSDTLGNYGVVTTYEDGYITSYKSIPTDKDICPLCNKGWYVGNCHKFHQFRGADFNGKFLHVDCYREWLKNHYTDMFTCILRDAGFDAFTLSEIPNQYCKNDNHPVPPWFNININDQHVITIGWRKRVVSIELCNGIFSMPPDLIKELQEKRITCWDTGCHAWNVEKTTEYLTIIRKFNHDKISV